MNGISPQEKKDERLCNQGEGYVITLQPSWPYRSKCFPEGHAPCPLPPQAPSPPASSAPRQHWESSWGTPAFPGEAGLSPSYLQSSLYSVLMTVSSVQGSMFVPIWLPFLLDPKQLPGRSEHVTFTTVSSLPRKHCPGHTGSPRGKRNLHIKAGGDLSLPRQLW